MNKIEAFFLKTNFDQQVKKAFKKDIVFIGQKTQEVICGYGLYNEWEGGPDGDWMVCILTQKGRESISDTDLYATGSWDGFDQATSPESYELIRDISEAMDQFHDEICEEIDDEDKLDIYFHEFLEAIMQRCAKILIASTPLIKEHFSTSDDFIVSVAAHEETNEARERIENLMGSPK